MRKVLTFWAIVTILALSACTEQRQEIVLEREARVAFDAVLKREVTAWDNATARKVMASYLHIANEYPGTTAAVRAKARAARMAETLGALPAP